MRARLLGYRPPARDEAVAEGLPAMAIDAAGLPDPAAAFSAAQAAALVHAVAVHDEVDLAAGLPARVPLDYPPALLEQGYWLSYRLWQEVERGALAGLAWRLVRHGRLSPEESRALKDIRARAKQLRFAFVMLDARHLYPRRLDLLTRLMGEAQDAARSGRRWHAAAVAIPLRLLLARPAWRAIDRELLGFAATGSEGFRAHVHRQIDGVARALAAPAVTNQRFHETRKVVSRLVATYDTFTVLAPSDHHRAVDRYLSTINGLMGGLHDAMAARRVTDRRGYCMVAEAWPPAVAERLTRLVAAFATG